MKPVTLHTIAKKIMLSRQDKSDIYIPNYILYGKEAVDELTLRGFMPIESVMLDLDKNTHSAPLPENYVKYVKVGICIGGRILELDYDDTLCVRAPEYDFCKPVQDTAELKSDCECLRRDCIPDGYSNYYMWNNIFYNGESLPEFMSIPAYRSKGFFKIENGRIYLNSVCAGAKVVMQYKATGVSESGKTQVPHELQDVVLYYIVWKNAFFDKNSTERYIERCEKEYLRKKDLVAISVTLNSVLDMLKEEMKSTYMANPGR